MHSIWRLTVSSSNETDDMIEGMDARVLWITVFNTLSGCVLMVDYVGVYDKER